MSPINPNKETIRRVSTMYNCNTCWLLDNDQNPLTLLVDIKVDEINRFQSDLKDWSGSTFEVLNFEASQEIIDTIKCEGLCLLPINSSTALTDVESRRRRHHKKAGI